MSDQASIPPCDERWKYTYHMLASAEPENFYPEDYRRLDGVLDFHIHVGYGRIDALSQMKRASRAGMRGAVFKISQFPTVELARTTNQAVREWAEREGVRPAEAFGGVVLGALGGGINLRVAKRIIRIGGRVIWLPVLEAAQHLEQAVGCATEDARRRGVYLLSGGRLLPQVVELIKIVAGEDVALSLGHAGPEEMLAVAEEIDKAGYKKAFVDHPFNPPLQLSANTILDLVRAGLNLNWTLFELSHWCGVHPGAMAEMTRKVGVDRVILSTDGCIAAMPDAVEGMRLMVETFRMLGFDAGEIRKMDSLNACRLLGIEPYPPLAASAGHAPEAAAGA